MSTDATYQKAQIHKHLIGATIIGIAEDPDDPEFFGIVARKGKVETIAWINQDAEGNGPGWLDLQAIVN